MLSRTISILAFAAAIGSGLVGGIFFAFSAFIMKALGGIAVDSGVAAMQAINIAVLNPLFFLVFIGTGAICLAIAGGVLLRLGGRRSRVLLAASGVYLIGSVAVTVFGNVPLNDALAIVDSHSVAGAAMWPRYLDEWVNWNHVRTIASIGSAILFSIALIQRAYPDGREAV